MKLDTPLNLITITDDNELFFNGRKVAYVLNRDALGEMLTAITNPELAELHETIDHLKKRVLEEFEINRRKQ